MNQKPLEPNRSYLIKQTTQVTQARVREIRYRIDVNTLEHQPADELQLNEIGVVSVEAQRPLLFDPYRKNRFTGSFILIDPITNETMGAGMIAAAGVMADSRGRVTAVSAKRRGHGATVVLLPPGQSELAYDLERLLFDHGWLADVVDQPEHIRQAVITACAAGMVAIVVTASVEDAAAAKVPPVRQRSSASRRKRRRADDPARGILRRLVHRDEPLTGGAGI